MIRHAGAHRALSLYSRFDSGRTRKRTPDLFLCPAETAAGYCRYFCCCLTLFMACALILPGRAAASPPAGSPPSTTSARIDPAVAHLTRITDELIGEPARSDDAPPSVATIMEDLRQQEEDYLKLLDEGSSATGLYASGEYTNDSRNGEDRYYGQLEWRLFNDGLLEDLRKEDKKILQTRLELLQLNRDMETRRLDESLYRLFTVENQLSYLHAGDRAVILEKMLRAREQAGEKGYTVKTDPLEIRLALDRARRRQAFYRQRRRGRLTPRQASLLNRIEEMELLSPGKLRKMAMDRIDDLKIQEVFVQRAEQYPAWSDNLGLDLYAGYKKEFYDRERDYVGIKIDIPLYWDDRADDLIKSQQRIYRLQQQAIIRRIEQQLDKLTTYFALHRQKLRAASDRLLLVRQQQENARREIHYSIQRQADDPTRILDTLRLRQVDIRYEAMGERLRILEILLKLQSLTRAETIRELFVSAR